MEKNLLDVLDEAGLGIEASSCGEKKQYFITRKMPCLLSLIFKEHHVAKLDYDLSSCGNGKKHPYVVTILDGRYKGKIEKAMDKLE